MPFAMSESDLVVTPLGDGRFLVTRGTRRQIAYGVATRDARWVFLDGRVHVIEVETTPRRRSRRAHDESALASPMPATVVLVNVEPGQQVSRGDLLVTLEAMKMEVPIKSPRDGRVRSIACRPGELVQPGILLLELEPEPVADEQRGPQAP
jgi:acetyl/propionyl-CoA carboxylase alpha subunit